MSGVPAMTTEKLRARVEIVARGAVFAVPVNDLAIARVMDAHLDAGLGKVKPFDGTPRCGWTLDGHPLLTADVLATSLQGDGVEVDLAGWPSRLRHAGCGAVMDGEAWRAQPSITAIKEVFGAPMRPCLGCGSHVSAGQMQAVTGD